MDEINEEIENLCLKGERFLQAGNGKEAIKVFKKACAVDDDPSHRNNLAMAYFLQKDYEKALWTLDSNIAEEAPYNPFAHALASLSLTQLGREKEAIRQLDAAIRDFDRRIKKQAVPSYPWGEYSVIIMRAAAQLEKHRQVYELYRKWQNHHLNWENHFFGGAAAFNLGRYRQARKSWKAMEVKDSLSQGLIEVAKLVEKNTIPPFKMGYDYFPRKFKQIRDFYEDQPEEEFIKVLQAFARTRSGRMGFLATAFSGEDFRQWAFEFLLNTIGPWEEELIKNFLQDNNKLSMELKIDLAQALVTTGFFSENEPITIMHEGQEQKIKLRKHAIILGTDEEWEKTIGKIQQLTARKEYDEALEVLNELKLKGKIYAEAIFIEANIYLLQNKPDEAYNNLILLEKITPQDPRLLLSFCSVFIQRMDFTRARSYLKSLEKAIEEDPPDSPSFLEQIAHLKTLLRS